MRLCDGLLVGNVSAVIQAVTFVTSHAELEKTERSGLSLASEAICVDVPLTCGEWVNQYKVEARRAIMQRYPGRAFALVSGIYNMDKEELHCSLVVLWQIMHLA